MDAAKVVVADDNLADEGLLDRIRRHAGIATSDLRRAIDVVMGVLHVAARIIYLDKAVHVAKLPFLKLHETARAVLPWQNDLYAVTEDCKKTIDPDLADEFEREASIFATEVIFQIDAFTEEAAGHDFNILVLVRLAKNYGVSLYSAIRRYVSGNHRACLVLVLEMPAVHEDLGFTCDLRRVIASNNFQEQFGELKWPEYFSPSDEIGVAIPVGGKRMSDRRKITLVDRNGNRNQCLAEAFTQSYQVFILVHSVKTLTARKVALNSS